MLSSLKYDNEEWSVRTWVKDGEPRPSVMIGSSPQYGGQWYDLVNGQMEGEEVDSPESRAELYEAVCASSPTSNLCNN